MASYTQQEWGYLVGEPVTVVGSDLINSDDLPPSEDPKDYVAFVWGHHQVNMAKRRELTFPKITVEDE